MLCFFTDAEVALYRELWHACAGPLVTVPREGERVFYFPQGHIEQVNSLSCFHLSLLLTRSLMVANLVFMVTMMKFPIWGFLFRFFAL